MGDTPHRGTLAILLTAIAPAAFGLPAPSIADTPPASTLEVGYPERHQNRTVVEIVWSLDAQVVEPNRSPDCPSIVLEMTGEILRRAETFDSFRYRFEFPAERPADSPFVLVAERALRPGAYRLELSLLDSAGAEMHQQGVDLVVPALRRRSAAAMESGEATIEGGFDSVAEESWVRLEPVPDRMLTGPFRVEAETQGESISKVRFVLDGKPVMTKSRPPYSVEIDLGRSPRLHRIEVEGLDRNGLVVARDSGRINGGPHRFAIRLLEPRLGRRYSGQVRAVAEVDLPRGERLDRVEFFLNETRIARLYQPPWIQQIPLPTDQRILYVRALAILEDGNSSEDLAFVKAPSQLDRLRVDLVELFVGVLDRNGDPVESLEKSDFVIFEDGVEQEISRLDFIRHLPIHAGLVLDTSTSMGEEIDAMLAAAGRFFERVVRPQDRAAVLVFDDSTQLRVPLTNDTRILTDSLTDLASGGDTRLYDALVESLYYFAGLDGKRALILISDGVDSASRYSFEEVLEYGQRSGIAVYPIVLGMSPRERVARGQMVRLARETGGRTFFARGRGDFDRIYTQIESELRSQYLLVYQSTRERSQEFRTVQVKLLSPGLKATTVPGYYP